MSTEEAAMVELKAATIGLRDAVEAQRLAAARYQAALLAFNKAVAPERQLPVADASSG